MSKKTKATPTPAATWTMKCISITGKIYYWTGSTHDVHGALVTMRDQYDNVSIPEHDQARYEEVCKVAKRIEYGMKELMSKQLGLPVKDMNVSTKQRSTAFAEAVRERCKKELMLT